MIAYVFRGLWRQPTRTCLTVGGTAAAITVWFLLGSLREGLERLVTDRRAERTLIVFQANRFCPSTSRLPEDYVRAIAALPGVQEVIPIQVHTNNCRASLDVILFHGIPAEKLRARRAIEIVEGDWSAFEGRGDGALVGAAVAARRKLAVGQRFSIGEVTVTVAGIFRGESAVEDNLIYTPLAFLQRTAGLDSVATVTQFEVLLDPSADPNQVSGGIDDLFRAGPVATQTRTKGVFQASTLGDLAELVEFTRYVGYACVALVLGMVAATTSMNVQDRTREYAVLRTIGFSEGRVFALILLESALTSGLGGALGTAAAAAALGASGLTVGAEAVLIAFAPSVAVAATSLVLALAAGVAAAIAPAFHAARAEIVASLRTT